jgi:hypothetical protein
MYNQHSLISQLAMEGKPMTAIESIAGMDVTIYNVQLRAGALQACDEARAWLDTQTSARAAWETCERPDWMIWLARRCGIEHKTLVRIACDCARTALRFVPEGEKRLLIAIETTEAWIMGSASIEDVRTARRGAAAYAAAAYAAAAYAAAAYAAAADAAYAAYAADAADAAYAAAADAYAADAYAAAAAAAADAAYAAYADAYAADAADADADARRNANIQMCGIVRKHITLEQIAEGMFR